VKCIICKKEYQGYGNNAEPIAKGQCCNECNELVIIARLRQSVWGNVAGSNKSRTNEIKNAIEKDPEFANVIRDCLWKYMRMDWGDTCKDDCKLNDNAVYYNDDRVVAKYKTNKGNIFIITECDRSATTIMFATEY
jgi:hypothetical protein